MAFATRPHGDAAGLPALALRGPRGAPPGGRMSPFWNHGRPFDR